MNTRRERWKNREGETMVMGRRWRGERRKAKMRSWKEGRISRVRACSRGGRLTRIVRVSMNAYTKAPKVSWAMAAYGTHLWLGREDSEEAREVSSALSARRGATEAHR